MRVLGAGAVALGLSLGVSPAMAAETIGAKLTDGGAPVGSSFVGQCSTGQFGDVHDALPAARQAPGGLTPDSHGIITRWRVTWLAASFGAEYVNVPLALRVYADNGSNSYTAVPPPPAGAAVVEMPGTRVPIDPGQDIGIENQNTSGLNKCVVVDTVAGSCPNASDILPAPLAQGAPATGVQQNICLFVQADVEPDADRDGFGDETQDLCPTNASTQGACPTTAAPAVAAVADPCAGLKGKARERCLCKQKRGKARRKCLRRLKQGARKD